VRAFDATALAFEVVGRDPHENRDAVMGRVTRADRSPDAAR
jgi:hypothetical protein